MHENTDPHDIPSHRSKTPEEPTIYIATAHCIRILREHRPQAMRGYAERIVRNEFEKRGIVVWRGGFVHARRSERYPRIELKYARLEQILMRRYPGTLEVLQYLSSTQYGMPDLVTWNGSVLRFVEVKLDYEPISERQRACMMRLTSLGFSVVIARVVSRSTRSRESEINLETREEHEKSRQLRLDAFS